MRYLVEQGADMEMADGGGWTPLIMASNSGHLEMVRYLLEQGADRDKADISGRTSLHRAAVEGHLEIAKLLMVYEADLNVKDDFGKLPIDIGGFINEEIKQAIRGEPRRRLDEAPGKRATEQDRHTIAPASASAQQEEAVDAEEMGNKRQRLDGEAEAEEGEVAEEDEDSEPSNDGEDD